ncbi:MAG: NifB/NifX family molybdenum-iron cluster-binding protein [Draconibacterium sp.]
MRRVAIPIQNNVLSEYFGGCNYYEIFEIENDDIRKASIEIPEVEAADELPGWLEKRGITDVIAYKVKKEIIRLFASRKINLFVGVPQEDPARIIETYLSGKLESDKRIIEELTN